MAESFQFKLITPTGVLMDAPVEGVIAHSSLGEFGVLAHHIDFITSLIPGVLRVKTGADREADYVVMGGLAAVRAGAMTVLASEVQSPENVDRAAAAAEAKTAEDLLSRTSYFDLDYAAAEDAVLVARARQQAADLKRPPR